jgi:hypothetical protein
MNAAQTEQQSLHIGQERLLAFVRSMIDRNSGRPDDEHPLPAGPWGPVIRIALERLSVFGPRPEPWRMRGSIFGPSPEPWRLVLESILARHPEIYDAIGGGHRFGEEVELNPQPLPPRYAFLVAVAQTVVRRAELMQEIADSAEQRGIIIVGGYTSRFCDDWCGNGFRLDYPFPGPRPNWFPHELDGIDLVVIATQFEQAAKEAFSPNLRQHLANASARFVEAGLSMMQS